MSAVCARCNHVYDQGSACPRCGLPHQERGDNGPPPSHGPRWLQTSWGRIAIGLILAQGLFYGLRHLVTGLFLATSGGDADAVWTDMRNLIALQVIQLLGLILGGALAGGGQRSGYFLGGMVGAWNGVLAVVFRQNPLQELTAIVLYGQPLLHVFIGAVGGAIGAFIWRPIPLSGVPLALAPPRKPAPRRKSTLLEGRIHFIRIAIGTALAVAGTLSATLLFDKVLELSGGKLGTSSVLQDQLITWEIKALALIVGGALAGATTANGVKQGLCVGLMTSVLLIGIQAPRTDRWFEVALFTSISTFTLSVAGGWFGSALFPPTINLERRGSAY